MDDNGDLLEEMSAVDKFEDVIARADRLLKELQEDNNAISTRRSSSPSRNNATRNVPAEFICDQPSASNCDNVPKYNLRDRSSSIDDKNAGKRKNKVEKVTGTKKKRHCNPAAQTLSKTDLLLQRADEAIASISTSPTPNMNLPSELLEGSQSSTDNLLRRADDVLTKVTMYTSTIDATIADTIRPQNESIFDRLMQDTEILLQEIKSFNNNTSRTFDMGPISDLDLREASSSNSNDLIDQIYQNAREQTADVQQSFGIIPKPEKTSKNENSVIEVRPNTFSEASNSSDHSAMVFVRSTSHSPIETIDLCDSPIMTSAALRRRVANLAVSEIIDLDDSVDAKPPKTPVPVVIAAKAEVQNIPQPAGNNDTICAICLEIATKNRPAATVCGHIFCVECITQAVKYDKKCPTCKKYLSTKQFFRIFL